MQSEAMKAVHAAIACDHIQLENGLTVLVRPMPQFSGVPAQPTEKWLAVM